MKTAAAVMVLFLLYFMPLVCLADPNVTLSITEDTLNRFVGRLGILSKSGVYQAYKDHVYPGFEFIEPVGYLLCPELGHGEVPGIGQEGIPILVGSRDGMSLEFIPIGEPVPYKWWVKDAHFTMLDDSMTFTATVITLAEGVEKRTTRTVAAWVSYVTNTGRIKMNIAAFTVDLIQVVGGPGPELVAAGEEEEGREFIMETVDVAKLYGISIPVEPQTISLPTIQGSDTMTIRGRVNGIPEVEYNTGSIILHFNVGFSKL
jgi:hypothetical protein